MSIHVTVEAITTVEPAEAFRRLADYAHYPDYTATVRSVELYERDGEKYSTWRVDFRGGILCWTERDEIDADQLRLAFVQVDGDLDRFDGGWTVHPAGSGARLIFAAELDLGIPSLAPLVDPIAEAALDGNIRTILSGLFDDVDFDVDGVLAAAST